MLDVGIGVCRKGHTQTKEEQVPARNPNDVILSDELNYETLQNRALRR